MSPPLRIYVHIPYCAHKCHYCDFNSHVRKQVDWSGWLQAIKSELTFRSAMVKSDRPIHSIFIGGGTPSLAPAAIIDALLKTTAHHFSFHSDIEISMEANPGTVDAKNFNGYRQAGVNRLSMGVQSLRSSELVWLERIHDVDQAVRAFALARQAGFENINLDFMYGLPAQTMDEWLDSLNQAVQLQPEHLSCYQLTVEANTRLSAMHANNPDMAWPNESLAAEFFEQTRGFLQQAGYRGYEISNYSLPGYQCRHNDGYWLYDDYLGLGPGAAGKVDQADGSVYRYNNIRSPEVYIKKTAEMNFNIHEEEHLHLAHAAQEAFWLALRRNDGVKHDWFRQRFGQQQLQLQQQACHTWQQSGHLHDDGSHSWLDSSIGILLADSIASSIFEGSSQ